MAVFLPSVGEHALHLPTNQIGTVTALSSQHSLDGRALAYVVILSTLAGGRAQVTVPLGSAAAWERLSSGELAIAGQLRSLLARPLDQAGLVLREAVSNGIVPAGRVPMLADAVILTLVRAALAAPAAPGALG